MAGKNKHNPSNLAMRQNVYANGDGKNHTPLGSVTGFKRPGSNKK